MSDMTENRQVPVPLHTLTYAATALEGSADNGDRHCAQQIRDAIAHSDAEILRRADEIRQDGTTAEAGYYVHHDFTLMPDEKVREAAEHIAALPEGKTVSWYGVPVVEQVRIQELARKIRNGEDEPEVTWEYGFYDSEHPEKIWWYVFGLPFLTAESAKHTGDKNVFGQTIIVRRPKGSEDWHRVDSEEIVARRTSDDQIETIENEADRG